MYVCKRISSCKSKRVCPSLSDCAASAVDDHGHVAVAIVLRAFAGNPAVDDHGHVFGCVPRALIAFAAGNPAGGSRISHLYKYQYVIKYFK